MTHDEIKAEFTIERRRPLILFPIDDAVTVDPAAIEREAAYLYALIAFWYVADPLEFEDTSWKIGGVWRHTLDELVRAL